MIYLASPYSHEQASVRHRRFLDARDFTYAHLSRGVPLFSPIVYGHQFSADYQMGTAHEDWLSLNVSMLNAAEMMWVLCLEGWEQSRGVAHEIDHMIAQGKTVYYKKMPKHNPIP